jgi:hypothetical protein
VSPGALVYHILKRSVAGLPWFRKRADYEAFERTRIASRRPYGSGCEKMGLAPSENPENLGKSVTAKVPAPIFHSLGAKSVYDLAGSRSRKRPPGKPGGIRRSQWKRNRVRKRISIRTKTNKLKALDRFSVLEFHGKSIEWEAVETEVSPSNFIFSAKDIVCYPRVPPAVKNEIGTTDLRSRKS